MTAPALIDFSSAQLSTIKEMCAKDCNNLEFDVFLEMCRARGLNPLLNHIYAMVLHKDDPKKRQLKLIVSIDGQRYIANRKGDYRPDDKVARYEIDADLKGDPLNPAGLISAEVGCYVHRYGEWHYVPHIAYWEEYAPLIEVWDDDPKTGKRGPTGRFILDPKKQNWRKMPRIMLAKCAEFGALRKAFPDDYSGLYGEEEMDRTLSTIDMTASQILEDAARQHRQQLVGGPGVMIDWMNGPLEKVALGQLHDRAVAFVRGLEGSPGTILAWRERNRIALRDLWAYSSGDADDLKREIEKAMAVTVEPQPETKPKKKAKAKEPDVEPAAKDTILPALRLRTDETEKSKAPSTLLRDHRSSLRELARKPPSPAGQSGAPSGVAPRPGRTPRRDP